MYYLIITLSVIVILFIALLVLSYASFVSIFMRGRNTKSEHKKIIRSLKANGETDPEEILKKSDGFFENKRYKKTTIYAFDETNLYARLYTPQNGDGEKTVLLAHGYNSSANADFYRLFDFYINGGYNILLIHQRAYANSSGRFRSLGILESYDILSWCQWLEMRFSTGCPIVIHGKNQGAFAAFCAAAMPELPANVSMVICENIFNSVDDVAGAMLKSSFDFLSKLMTPFVRSFYKSAAGFDMRSVTALSAAKRVKIPVLFINKNNTVLHDDMLEKIIKKINAESQSVSLKKSDNSETRIIKKFISC